jgi:hypothetical protein
MKVKNENSSSKLNFKYIPATLRIGITGHRELKDKSAIAISVREILKQLDSWFGNKLVHTPHTYSVISPLAEGSDRLVAREVLAWNTSNVTERPWLEAVLPLPEEEYIQDFTEQRSKEEFRELFNRKVSLKVFPSTASREMAYEEAGHYVVDNCDILIAVWDGQEAKGRGGTAEIVEYAKKIGRHIFWINSESGGLEEIEPKGNGRHYIESLKNLEEFNGERLAEEETIKAIEEMHSSLKNKAEDSKISTDFLRQVKTYFLPWFVRADLLALRYQKFNNLAGSAIYWLSALAVIMVAIYILFFPNYHKLILAEVVLIFMIFVLLGLSHWCRWLGKWIDYRFLAERLRAGIFLRAVGMELDRPKVPPYLSFSQRADDWIMVAFSWIWNLVDFKPIEFSSGLKNFLKVAWIEDQAYWYKTTYTRLNNRHEKYSYLGYGLFFLTLIVGLLHYLLHFGQFLHPLFTFFAIALPAIGAALHGIQAQRDYHRHAERYRGMVQHLEAISNQIMRTADVKALVDLLNHANEIMLREQQDWRVVVLFGSEIKPPA